MSEENVRLVYEVIDAFNRRDLDAYLALMDPEVEFTPYEVWSRGVSPIAAMPVSDAGGMTRSRFSQISRRRSMRYVTSTTGRL